MHVVTGAVVTFGLDFRGLWTVRRRHAGWQFLRAEVPVAVRAVVAVAAADFRVVGAAVADRTLLNRPQ